jgi:hypothetical protein
MAQTIHPDDAVGTTPLPKRHGFGHWLRVAVMFMSGGFAFPHVLTEEGDAGRNAKLKAGKTT